MVFTVEGISIYKYTFVRSTFVRTKVRVIYLRSYLRSFEGTFVPSKVKVHFCKLWIRMKQGTYRISYEGISVVYVYEVSAMEYAVPNNRICVIILLSS